jgi:alanine dehydrogenase
MNIGVLSEEGASESRVCLTPAGSRSLILAGHRVVVESGAGSAARFADEEYRKSGAWVVYDRDEVIGRADLVMKVSPLTPSQAALLREGQTVMAFHHLAAGSREMIEELMRRGVTMLGYEVIEDAHGDLPILHAMSEIAGQLSVHVAAHYLETRAGGRGILLGGATGIPPAHVVILGSGVVGQWAARTALGNGAQVTMLDSNLSALRRAEELLGRGVVTEVTSARAIARAAAYADVLVGAVLIRGERAPHLVTREMVEGMKPGSVIVDVSIDQGGCVETSRPTTLEDPIFTECGVTHFAVPNMPSAVARTASLALTAAALPFVQALADEGVELALRDLPGMAAGVYIFRGDLVFEGVARAFGLGCQTLQDLIGSPGRAGGILA